MFVAAVSLSSQNPENTLAGTRGRISVSGPEFLRSLCLSRFGLGAVATSLSVQLRTAFDPANRDVYRHPLRSDPPKRNPNTVCRVM
jgi:hypothetical protein